MDPRDFGEAFVEEAASAALHAGNPRSQRRPRHRPGEAAAAVRAVGAARQQRDAVRSGAAARVGVRPHRRDGHAMLEPPAGRPSPLHMRCWSTPAAPHRCPPRRRHEPMGTPNPFAPLSWKVVDRISHRATAARGCAPPPRSTSVGSSRLIANVADTSRREAGGSGGAHPTTNSPCL